jgi:hypothetical protein
MMAIASLEDFLSANPLRRADAAGMMTPDRADRHRK